MIAGKGTSSGKLSLRLFPKLRELAFIASYCMTRILDGDGAEELRQPDVSLLRLPSGVLRRVAVVRRWRRRLPLPQEQLPGLPEAAVAVAAGHEGQGLRVRVLQGQS